MKPLSSPFSCAASPSLSCACSKSRRLPRLLPETSAIHEVRGTRARGGILNRAFAEGEECSRLEGAALLQHGSRLPAPTRPGSIVDYASSSRCSRNTGSTSRSKVRRRQAAQVATVIRVHNVFHMRLRLLGAARADYRAVATEDFENAAESGAPPSSSEACPCSFQTRPRGRKYVSRTGRAHSLRGKSGYPVRDQAILRRQLVCSTTSSASTRRCSGHQGDGRCSATLGHLTGAEA